jgi:hypothetical protein
MHMHAFHCSYVETECKESTEQARAHTTNSHNVTYASSQHTQSWSNGTRRARSGMRTLPQGPRGPQGPAFPSASASFWRAGRKKKILLAIPRIEDHAENGNLCYAFIGDDSCIRGHLSTTATSSTKVYDARTVSRSKRFTCKRRRDAATISLFSASSPRRTPRIYNNGAA